MVAGQAVAIKCEWLPLLEIGERGKKRLEIAGLVKHSLAIVAAIDDVVN
jgi:hypothetical protein